MITPELMEQTLESFGAADKAEAEAAFGELTRELVRAMSSSSKVIRFMVKLTLEAGKNVVEILEKVPNDPGQLVEKELYKLLIPNCMVEATQLIQYGYRLRELEELNKLEEDLHA